ncbi:hypothetical protein B0I73DRAFT_135981 [Yarrowia lipolytica]|nr:hypothetical protein BKA91DRAFT_142866 [Yarrowia lipolytica]KAE8173155.1 hypothetical protein BKA90DRAFT_135993 [Yarrowia lipolytica]RDW37131.1 hypothetical protein B0I73DRAFT_135981 [Yarrowia lipolytica]RMI95558.1 hypothetical protein BD777DRAFT_129986 [Yarrowia lipolytica]
MLGWRIVSGSMRSVRVIKSITSTLLVLLARARTRTRTENPCKSRTQDFYLQRDQTHSERVLCRLLCLFIFETWTSQTVNNGKQRQPSGLHLP